MPDIKILDCTLRDGGYVNDWTFGYRNISEIVNNLTDSGIDYIECGFLKNTKYEKEKSIFSNVSQLEKIIDNYDKTFYTLMINFGQYDADEIKQAEYSNILFRIAFKKHQYAEAVEYAKRLKDKGYNIFLNPMHTNTYSQEELLNLVNLVNGVEPVCFSIVDTTGGMREKDVISLFNLIDNNLTKNIALGFHSHNNLLLSFSNAQCLMNHIKDRELIIDSTVYGIGRGAGNLCTELLVEYLNNYNPEKYEIEPVLNIIQKQINPIYKKTPWGYSIPYYLSAVNKCHPNYAEFLIKKSDISAEKMNRILLSIPDQNRSCYDEDLINKIYLENV